MRLNHLDLQVRDVPATSLFFEQLFGLTLRSNRSSPAIAILTDGHGCVLVLQRCHDEAELYPRDFHLGFLVDDVDEVHKLHALAREAGADVGDVIVNGRGTMIYIRRPEGYRVEVSCQRARFDRE